MACIITGATSGIGAACARRFAAQGIPLVVIGRRKDRLGSLADSLRVPVLPLELDVGDSAAVADALGAGNLPEDFKPRYVINSAGGALGLDKADTASMDDWQGMIAANIGGVVNVVHAVLPGMVERATKEQPGHILNIGSVAGGYPYPGGSVYGGCKSFVNQFSLNLRADLCGRFVKVTDVQPGMVETEFSVVRFSGDEEKARNVYQGMTPMTGDDIANTCEYIMLTLPPHVNVNQIELMPEQQAFGPFQVSRD